MGCLRMLIDELGLCEQPAQSRHIGSRRIKASSCVNEKKRRNKVRNELFSIGKLVNLSSKLASP
jgi:hypothetical protein